MKVGIAGLGIMGTALAVRLLQQKAEVAVTNRTREKASGLLAQGAQWAATPRELAAQCDIVISLVTDPKAVEAVTFGGDGILAGLKPGAVHCDMSTVAPAWAAYMEQEYKRAGRTFVQAPVLGSRAQIEQGTLLIFAGGNESAIENCAPAWELFSQRTWHIGTPEQAATAKLACNMMIAHMVLGLGQSLIFAKKGGVDPAALIEIVQASSLASAMYGSKGKSLLAGNFAANFSVDNMLKDLTLATDAALRTKTPVPFAALEREQFSSASAHGYGAEDYSAVVKVLEALAATTLRPSVSE